MATADSVKNQLAALLAQANDATGNTDTDLTAAVAVLVAGFGQGGADWKKVGTYTPVTANYVTAFLFSTLALTASYSSGVIIIYGNVDITTMTGCFVGVFIYTDSEVRCFLRGAYNGSATQTTAGEWTRTEQGIGEEFGYVNVGNVRSGYIVAGSTYNVYECEIPDEFAKKITAYFEEETV